MSIKKEQIPKKLILYHSFPLDLYGTRFPTYIQTVMLNNYTWNILIQRKLSKGKYLKSLTNMERKISKIDLRIIQRHCKYLKRTFNRPLGPEIFTRLPRIENVYVNIEDKKQWRVLLSKRWASCITICFPLSRDPRVTNFEGMIFRLKSGLKNLPQ